ncbi:hypothetical protein [Capnocytophaga catalasegens]|nr:hypothetical protein [Capnocytophaga catalasegens]
MKKLFVILFGIIIASCGNKDNTPEVVTQKFITAVNQEKFDEAKKYCDEQTAQMLDTDLKLIELPVNPLQRKEIFYSMKGTYDTTYFDIIINTYKK